ncbi:MAG: hypothetical protein GY850_08725 [bacterium]|nr:hypothetical protein [bacterium]
MPGGIGRSWGVGVHGRGHHQKWGMRIRRGGNDNERGMYYGVTCPRAIGTRVRSRVLQCNIRGRGDMQKRGRRMIG